MAYTNKTSNIGLGLLSFLLLSSSALGVVKLPSFLYFLSITLFLFYSLVRKNKFNYSLSVFSFLLICLFSIIYNNPPYYFKSYYRFYAFLLVLVSFSPLLSTYYMRELRLSLFNSLIRFLLILSVLSFFCFFVGINYFERLDIDGDLELAGQFSGLFKHSMQLAPFAAISSIYTFAKFLCSRRKSLKYAYGLLSCVCFGATLLAASRGALLALFFGLIYLIFQFCKKKKLKPHKYILVFLLFGILTYPVWGGLTSFVAQKNEYGQEHGGIMSSRERKNAARLYEIQNHFFSGVGFSVVDESVDTVNRENGQIEPNSSWLAVWSMTGIFGFVMFVYIFIVYVKKTIKISNIFLSTMYGGVLVFFSIHMFIEGYVFAAGSMQCVLFWLVIGCVDAVYIKESVSILG